MEAPKILKENSMDSILKLECFLWNVPNSKHMISHVYPLRPITRYLDSAFQKGRNRFFGGEKTHAKTIRIRNYWLKYDGNPIWIKH